MTYVASSYYDIVEDLLIALTGGVTRETFIFTPGEACYFESYPVNPDSVKVVGIRGKEIYHFIEGQDFTVDKKQEKITWNEEKNGANLPDEGSKFYVNYHKAGVEPILSDTNVGSVTRTLAEAFARELAVISQQILFVYNSGFLDTARGDALDQVVAVLGEKYARKSGDYATGDVRFYRSSPAPADIFLNDGILVSTDIGEPKIYETIQEKILRKGKESVLVPVRAIKKGQDGITEAGAIRVMIQPVMGIDGVTNPHEILPTGIYETDEELRERAKHALEAAGGTTSNAIKYALMSIPALSGKSINVEEDFSQGNGLVKVIIDAEWKEDLVTEIDRKIFETRAAGIKVVHNLSTNKEGIYSKLNIDFKEKLVAVKVIMSLKDNSISSSEKEGIKDQVLSEIETYFEKLKIGEPLLKNKLISLLFGIEGIKDTQIKFKHPNIENLPDEIPAESNERIKLLKDQPEVENVSESGNSFPCEIYIEIK
jgi:uncharacterized phage protein gp47/JayE